MPGNLSLVPVDFEKDALIDNLRMSGYRADASALFSWLGVTMYLSTDAIFGTLRAVAGLASGTEIIVEYNAPKDSVDQETQQVLAAIMKASQARGEPQPTSFEPIALADQVRQIGFAEVSDFGPDDAAARYFKNRADGLRPFAVTHYLRAQVGPRSTQDNGN